MNVKNNNITNLTRSFILAVGICLSGYFISYAILNFHNFNRYVSVKGLAEQTVTANKAIWIINYTVNESDLSTLYTAITHNQTEITSFLVANKITNNEIQYGSISTNKNVQTKDQSNSSKFTAYAKITITTDKVALIRKLSQKTIKLVSKGVLISNSDVKYKYTLLNNIKPSMLKSATNNAKIAAQKFAENSNSELGSLRQANQGSFSISDSDGSYGNSDISKIVRIVVNTQYFLD
jgi:hypothetical protein